MNVSSLEPSKELYELSGWKNTDYWWRLHKPNGLSKLYTLEEMDHDNYRFRNSPDANRFQEENEFFAAYDLGYLLRKLPVGAKLFHVKAAESGEFYWACEVYKERAYYGETSVDTPEDAAAKLAIELFKQGVLTRGGDE